MDNQNNSPNNVNNMFSNMMNVDSTPKLNEPTNSSGEQMNIPVDATINMKTSSQVGSSVNQVPQQEINNMNITQPVTISSEQISENLKPVFPSDVVAVQNVMPMGEQELVTEQGQIVNANNQSTVTLPDKEINNNLQNTLNNSMSSVEIPNVNQTVPVGGTSNNVANQNVMPMGEQELVAEQGQIVNANNQSTVTLPDREINNNLQNTLNNSMSSVEISNVNQTAPVGGTNNNVTNDNINVDMHHEQSSQDNLKVKSEFKKKYLIYIIIIIILVIALVLMVTKLGPLRNNEVNNEPVLEEQTGGSPDFRDEEDDDNIIDEDVDSNSNADSTVGVDDNNETDEVLVPDLETNE